MLISRTVLLALLLAVGLVPQVVFAQDINLLPKYGLLPKTDAQKKADAIFLAAMDKQYKGNRKKAAEDMALRGWEYLREQDMDVAMKRFNQAWLLDSSNGKALWGMATIEAIIGEYDESLKLFAEAERSVGDDINFSVDYAKAMGVAGAEGKNEERLKDAYARFARIYEKAPQNTLNLENWAMTLYRVGDYAGAWKKVKLAEATPGGGDLDPRFLEALQSKMQQPTNLPPQSGPLPKNEAQGKAFWVTMVHDYNFATNDISQKMNLQPKYGSVPKNDALKTSDAKFLAAMDDLYKGNRKKAAEDMALRGWQFLREGNAPDAMRRFDQAWLLDNSNGNGLWGMAAVEAVIEKFDESLKLFAEAERSIGDDINFSVDCAKAMGLAGARGKNEALLKDAFARFAQIYEKAPRNTLNLEDWGKTLFLVGDYAEAWKKVKLAEATPGGADLDPRFLAALESKMPRP